MAPSKKHLYHTDASDMASAQLTHVLKSEEEEERVSVEEALRGKSVYEVESDRDVTRVLFISRDTNLLNPTQQSLDGFINVSDLFDEVHIVILRQGIPAKHPVLRVKKNVWLYTASAKHWWQTPMAGMDLIDRELSFADGFRPDLVVARDPFECAYLAQKVAKKYNRPSQLHILDDYTDSRFIKENKSNAWRSWLTKFFIPKFDSVRTANRSIQEIVENNFSIKDIKTLPRFHNYHKLITGESGLDLKSKYKPIIFFMLYVGKLGYDSNLYKALDAARFALTNMRLGMIIVGDGPAKGEFKQRAKLLKIENQVIFVSKVDDVNAYIKAANMLIVTDTDFASEDVVLRGAACGTPMVLARTGVREDLFEDGASAFLCDPDNVQEFTNSINDLLNDISLRLHFGHNTKAMMRERFHEDPEEYRLQYRLSIEQAFFVGEEDEKDGEEAKTSS